MKITGEAVFNFSLIPTETNYRNEFAHNCLWRKVIRGFISRYLRRAPSCTAWDGQIGTGDA